MASYYLVCEEKRFNRTLETILELREYLYVNLCTYGLYTVVDGRFILEYSKFDFVEKVYRSYVSQIFHLMNM